MAGLSLITSHTSKAYAQTPNCGRGGGSVTVIQHSDKPIVCDKSSGTRILSSTSGGREIEIDMNQGPGEAIKITGPNTNITIMKKITVTGSRGSGKPVIKVLSGGALTLNQEVDVSEATGMIKKEIVVDGSESSVTLNGKLTGFEGGEVKVSNEGMVVFEKGVKGIEEVKVKINDGGMVRLLGDVTFN
ncbi:hypothetical protein, partial [Bartonella bovis]|uniref:hypothetical protein n=1 Tax=Bartonella bovis TaxID=155194 RepID=UPI0011AFBE23